jgi:hypothetical protein
MRRATQRVSALGEIEIMRVSKLLAGVSVASSLILAAGAAWAATSAWQGDPPLKEGGWRVISVDKSSLIMIEGDGIERRGNEARMWVALLFPQPQTGSSKPYSVLLARSSFDCSAKTWRPITLETLDANGAVVSNVDATSKPSEPAEGFQADLLAKACNPSTLDVKKMDDVMGVHGAYVSMVADGSIK